MYIKYSEPRDNNMLQKNAVTFFRGSFGWPSIREILSRESRFIIRMYDFTKPGSAIKNYARYTLGQYGWKEYMSRDLQEMPAKTRREADPNIESEQPFALFAELHQANKDKPGVWATTDKDSTVLYYRFENSPISVMEIQSRKNKNQSLLFIVLGKIPSDKIDEQNWEESVLVLRSDKPFNIKNNPAHLLVIEEARNSAVVAYKERAKREPITITGNHSLPIHKAAKGSIYIAEEYRLTDYEIPEDVKQDSLRYLESAASEAFAEAVLRELKTRLLPR